jgi:hypothetical protein
MSIAEQIMLGSQQQSKNWSVLSDSIGKLGQQIGQSLAAREYQKQAQAVLPLFQQSMQEAMVLANNGDSGLAYSKLMPFITDPSTANNPYTFPAIKESLNLIEKTAAQSARNIRAETYRNRYSGGGLPGMQPSGAETAMGALGLTPTQPQPEAIMRPEGTPVDESLPAGGSSPSAVSLTEGAQDIPPTPEGVVQPDKTQIEAAQVANKATNATSERYNEAVEGATISKSDDTSNWQSTEIVGLSKLFPKLNLSDKIKIAPVGTKTEYSQTWSGETDKPGARFSGTRSVKIDEDLNKKANEYASALQESVSLIDNNGPENSDKTWAEIIQEAGGIGNVIPAAIGDNQYSVKVKGKESYDIDKGTAEAFRRVKGFPAFASITGIKAVRVGGPATAELASRKFASREEAEAANLPVGTTVYVLRNGKYVKAVVK